MLIREGRGGRNKGETVKGNSSAALRQDPGTHSRDVFMYNNIFELFCRQWNLEQVEVNCVLPQARRCQTDWNRRLMMLTPTYSPSVRRTSKSCSHSLSIITIKLLTTRSMSRHSSESISPLWPPLPGKAIKLFFFQLHPKLYLWDFTLCWDTEVQLGFIIWMLLSLDYTD